MTDEIVKVVKKAGRPEGSITRNRRRDLLMDEWLRFIKYVKEHASAEEYIFFSLVYALALRVHEACTLTWSMFNFPAQQVTITGAKNGTTVTSPIPIKLLKTLKAMHKASTSEWVFPARNADSYTGHYSEQTAKGRFKALIKAAGVPGVHSIHDLRRSRAQHLADANMNASVISATLRHKSTKTANEYLKPSISPAQQAAITAALNRML
jgi:integrase